MITAGNATLWMHAGEIHEYNARGVLIGMWRVSAGQWQHRTAWGDMWVSSDRPVNVDEQLVQRLEAARA